MVYFLWSISLQCLPSRFCESWSLYCCLNFHWTLQIWTRLPNGISILLFSGKYLYLWRLWMKRTGKCLLIFRHLRNERELRLITKLVSSAASIKSSSSSSFLWNALRIWEELKFFTSKIFRLWFFPLGDLCVEIDLVRQVGLRMIGYSSIAVKA